MKFMLEAYHDLKLLLSFISIYMS